MQRIAQVPAQYFNHVKRFIAYTFFANDGYLRAWL